MQYKDYYKVLDVDKNATQKEIKSAYRKLAREHHPDVNPDDPDAQERFKDINEAYQVLGDPEKRKKYDQLGANWRQWERMGGRPDDFNWQRWAAGQGGQRVHVRYAAPMMWTVSSAAWGASPISSSRYSAGWAAYARRRMRVAGASRLSRIEARTLSSPLRSPSKRRFTGQSGCSR